MIFYYLIIASRILSVCAFNRYKALNRSLLSSETNRENEEEEEEGEMITNESISFLCSKCGKTFAGKQSALNHANEYHKSKNSKEFVDQLMQEEW